MERSLSDLLQAMLIHGYIVRFGRDGFDFRADVSRPGNEDVAIVRATMAEVVGALYAARQTWHHALRATVPATDDFGAPFTVAPDYD